MCWTLRNVRQFDVELKPGAFAFSITNEIWDLIELQNAICGDNLVALIALLCNQEFCESVLNFISTLLGYIEPE